MHKVVHQLRESLKESFEKTKGQLKTRNFSDEQKEIALTKPIINRSRENKK